MKSIIIISNRTEPDKRLLELTGALFPRCEIRVASVDVEMANASEEVLPSKPPERPRVEETL